MATVVQRHGNCSCPTWQLQFSDMATAVTQAALKQGGDLYEKRVHLFGSTESHLLDIGGTVRTVHVPVIVAVDCPFTPLSTIGFTPLTLDGEDSVISVTYPLAPPMVWEFDWEMDSYEEFVHNVVLPENEKETLKLLLKAVQERKKQAKEERMKAIDAMDPETKKAYADIRFYKFYPVKTWDTPNVKFNKSNYIGKFCRNAHFLM
ncbi:hypothetical protein VPH35_116280 [Triticum aestivum]|uniref:Uncharacterized protein n=1 Tax=Aegilops tauschii TaxID=37682 RepID=M8CRD2_AEGTA